VVKKTPLRRDFIITGFFSIVGTDRDSPYRINNHYILETRMSEKTKTRPWILFLALMPGLLGLPRVASAQSETPSDLIEEVNNLRALHGLEAYQVDPWLMAYAQEHSEYQARMQSGTHLHSDGYSLGRMESRRMSPVGMWITSLSLWLYMRFGWIGDTGIS
jgi:uncharacterized protein YkwD